MRYLQINDNARYYCNLCTIDINQTLASIFGKSAAFHTVQSELPGDSCTFLVIVLYIWWKNHQELLNKPSTNIEFRLWRYSKYNLVTTSPWRPRRTRCCSSGIRHACVDKFQFSRMFLELTLVLLAKNSPGSSLWTVFISLLVYL